MAKAARSTASSIPCEHPDYITVTGPSIARAYFAVKMRWYDEDGIAFYDVEESGVGRYVLFARAMEEGREWAKEEGLEFRP